MSEDKHKPSSERTWTLRSIWQSVLDHAPVVIIYGILALTIQYFAGSATFPSEVNTITAALFIIVLAIITRPIYRFVFAKLRIYFVARQLVRSFGIESFWPHKDQGWKDCIRELQAGKPDTIRILAFTGASTFSGAAAPLHGALKAHRGNIEILLAQPNTPAFNHRLGQLRVKLGISAAVLSDRCRDELAQSVEYCKTLKGFAPDVSRLEIRQYDCEPIWKMVILGSYLWLQYYRPGQVNDDMPAYGLRKREDTSLAYPLQRVFDSLWALGADKVLLKIDDDVCVLPPALPADVATEEP